MMKTRLFVGFSCVSVITLAAGGVLGQSYPSKPVRMVTAEPGGGNDFVTRLIANGLTRTLGQQVIVENHGGANGINAVQTVAKAPPDGYSLLSYTNGLWLLPFLQSVPYDPLKDFVPITLAAKAPNVVVVHPSLPVHSIAELVALARAKPGELNYASGSTGSSPHLAAELFKSMAGVSMVRIPYKGAGPANRALIAGEVQVMFPAAGSVAPHLKSGRLRALAVTSVHPSALLGGLPTVAASGLPGYVSGSSYGVFAPTGTSAVVISLLRQEIVRAVNLPDVTERLFAASVETVGSTSAELTAAIKVEMASLGKVIKDAGIRGD